MKRGEVGSRRAPGVEEPAAGLAFQERIRHLARPGGFESPTLTL